MSVLTAPDVRRRRIVFRAWHRGMREMDLIMGRFADAHVEILSEPELDTFEALMEEADPSLYKWITGEEQPPANVDRAFLVRLRAFHQDFGSKHG